MIDKPVLDATCGSKMIWFNKNNKLAVYVDRRELDCEAIWTSGDGQSTRYCNIHPDIVADFTDLPFEDNTFYHIIFDPPHLVDGGDNAWMVKKYGKLNKDTWKQVLHDGFCNPHLCTDHSFHSTRIPCNILGRKDAGLFWRSSLNPRFRWKRICITLKFLPLLTVLCI